MFSSHNLPVVFISVFDAVFESEKVSWKVGARVLCSESMRGGGRLAWDRQTERGAARVTVMCLQQQHPPPSQLPLLESTVACQTWHPQFHLRDYISRS